IAVISRGVSEKANMIGRRLAFLAPLFEEGVEALADKRAGAVTGVLRDQKDIGRALHVQKIGVAFGRESLLLQLRAGAQRGFQLSARGSARRRSGERCDLGIVIAVM